MRSRTKTCRPLENQVGVKNSLLLEESWLSHIAILHSWCNFSLSYNPCHFFFFEIWICKSLNPWEFIIDRPAKSTKELGPAWQNIAGKSDIHGQSSIVCCCCCCCCFFQPFLHYFCFCSFLIIKKNCPWTRSMFCPHPVETASDWL